MKSITNVMIKRWGGAVCMTILMLSLVTLGFGHGNSGNPVGGIKTVVIDAGHGGKDPGALGRTTREKDIALKLALQLGEKIEKEFPDVNVVYTRKTDKFIELHNRAKIANDNNADLFISIHCNSVENNPNVHGSETFVLGLHKNKENLEIAKRENASILLEDNYKKNYDGYDPNSEVGHILLSMMQNNYLENSVSFASKIENNFTSSTSSKSRGVKQAGFLVLRQTFMPSVLIEAGFLSNSGDEAYLNSTVGQNAITNSILKAFASYKKEMDGTATSLAYSSTKPKTIESTIQEKNTPKEVVVTQKEVVVSTPPKPTSTSSSKSMPSYATGKTTSTATRTTTVSPKPTTSDSYVVKSTTVQTTTTRPTTASTTTSGNVVKRYQVDPQVISSGPVEYTVQLASASRKGDLTGQKWSRYKDQLMIRYENNAYKYQVGTFNTISQARAKQAEVKRNGFSDAFVVAYKDGKKVSLSSSNGLAAN